MADAPPIEGPPMEGPQCNKEFDTGECSCNIMIDPDECFVNCMDKIDSKKFYNVMASFLFCDIYGLWRGILDYEILYILVD